ncbi:hypothetical protein B0I37DRAFT_437514 [Chaetomium sp. MPI-CAGE-AT-0009]|nr:hypothetical protein B0I37DRAFT_437514 [Chaetomium sp. MPI-CAGE-AT-0009]
MVKIAVPLAALAMAASVAALPAATSPTTFSFAQWVEDIIANPDKALTADQAIEAAQAAERVGSAGGLQKRADCDHNAGFWPRANGRDAAACVEQLARWGAEGRTCGVPAGDSHNEMIIIRNAKIVGLDSTFNTPWVNCNDVARTAGLIFDSCWRADDTVMGQERCINSPVMYIAILGA